MCGQSMEVSLFNNTMLTWLLYTGDLVVSTGAPGEPPRTTDVCIQCQVGRVLLLCLLCVCSYQQVCWGELLYLTVTVAHLAVWLKG
jgi:hypothetical protein